MRDFDPLAAYNYSGEARRARARARCAGIDARWDTQRICCVMHPRTVLGEPAAPTLGRDARVCLCLAEAPRFNLSVT